MKAFCAGLLFLPLCHGAAHEAQKASLSQLDSIKQQLNLDEGYSSKLATFQKFAEEMVVEYGAPDFKQPDPEVLPAVKMILDFIDQMHDSLWAAHTDDVGKAKECGTDLANCTAHYMSPAIVADVIAYKQSSENAGVAHVDCREEVADSCLDMCSTNGGCKTYDNYRMNVDGYNPNPASLPMCANAPQQLAFTDEYISADDGDDKLEVMEACLKLTKSWFDPLYDKYLSCSRSTSTCQSKVPECDNLQHTFEQARDLYAVDTNERCEGFNKCWTEKSSECQTDCDAIAVRAAARAADNETGERLVCLLTTLFGKPDPSNSTGTGFFERTSDNVTACREQNPLNLNLAIWEITCPEGGTFPSATPESPQGIDCSTTVSAPCSTDFITSEYTNKGLETDLPSASAGCSEAPALVQRGAGKVVQECGTSPGGDANGAWTLAENGKSCDEACSSQLKHCSESGLRATAHLVDSEEEMAQVVQALTSQECTSYNWDFTDSPGVPFVRDDGMCVMTASDRPSASFKCNHIAPNNPQRRQRLCYCSEGQL